MSAKPGEEAQGFVRFGEAEANARQVVLVPGARVPMIEVSLPARLKGQAREKVARRQLSDRLGLRPDQIAMRPCLTTTQKPDGWTRVLTADPAWLSRLSSLPGRAVLPDYLALPIAADLWTMTHARDDGESWVVRLGPDDGFAAQPALALAALRRALEEGPAPKALLHLAEPAPDVRALLEAHDVALVSEVEALSDLGIAPPERLAHGELACDLRKNPMALRGQLARSVLPWRWTALAATLAAGVWAGGEFLALRQAQDANARLSAQTTQMVQSVFTDGGPVLDARLQVTRALAAMRGEDSETGAAVDPVDLGAQVAHVLVAARAETLDMAYRQGEGLRLVTHVADFAAAERLAEALRADGLGVDLRDSRAEEGAAGVRTEMMVTSAPEAPE